MQHHVINFFQRYNKRLTVCWSFEKKAEGIGEGKRDLSLHPNILLLKISNSNPERTPLYSLLNFVIKILLYLVLTFLIRYSFLNFWIF